MQIKLSFGRNQKPVTIHSNIEEWLIRLFFAAVAEMVILSSGVFIFIELNLHRLRANLGSVSSWRSNSSDC
jgi:hypothetical protein